MAVEFQTEQRLQEVELREQLALPVVPQQLEGCGERGYVDIAVRRIRGDAFRMLNSVRQHGEGVHIPVDGNAIGAVTAAVRGNRAPMVPPRAVPATAGFRGRGANRHLRCGTPGGRKSPAFAGLFLGG